MNEPAGSFHADVLPTRNDARHRYELTVGGQLAVICDYRELPGHTDFLHTETEERFRGQGLATVLARYSLDDVVASGKRIIPHCSFVAAYLRKHDDYVQCTDWPRNG